MNCDIQHNALDTECYFADCRKLALYTKCHYAECRYAECYVVMLNVIMLNAVMMSVVMLSAVAPYFFLCTKMV
jgi:hypothetical protein